MLLTAFPYRPTYVLTICCNQQVKGTDHHQSLCISHASVFCDTDLKKHLLYNLQLCGTYLYNHVLPANPHTHALTMCNNQQLWDTVQRSVLIPMC